MKPKNTDSRELPVGKELIEQVWKGGWTYIKTIVDVVHEPILILNKELCVLAANEPFYRKFQVEAKDTENTLVYKLGNGQWDIPSLRKLLEDILPKNTFFKGFEVIHEFPSIGRRVMMLNARQIHFKDDAAAAEILPPIMLLAIEDVTDMMETAESFAHYATELDLKFMDRAKELEKNISTLAEEIKNIKKKVQL